MPPSRTSACVKLPAQTVEPREAFCLPLGAFRRRGKRRGHRGPLAYTVNVLFYIGRRTGSQCTQFPTGRASLRSILTRHHSSCPSRQAQTFVRGQKALRASPAPFPLPSCHSIDLLPNMNDIHLCFPYPLSSEGLNGFFTCNLQ